MHRSRLEARQLRLDLAGYTLADVACQLCRTVSSQLPREAQLPVQPALLCRAHAVAAKGHVTHVYMQHTAVHGPPDLQQ